MDHDRFLQKNLARRAEYIKNKKISLAQNLASIKDENERKKTLLRTRNRLHFNNFPAQKSEIDDYTVGVEDLVDNIISKQNEQHVDIFQLYQKIDSYQKDLKLTQDIVLDLKLKLEKLDFQNKLSNSNTNFKEFDNKAILTQFFDKLSELEKRATTIEKFQPHVKHLQRTNDKISSDITDE